VPPPVLVDADVHAFWPATSTVVVAASVVLAADCMVGIVTVLAHVQFPVADDILSTPGLGYVPPRSPPALPFGGSAEGVPDNDEYASC